MSQCETIIKRILSYAMVSIITRATATRTKSIRSPVVATWLSNGYALSLHISETRRHILLKLLQFTSNK